MDCQTALQLLEMHPTEVPSWRSVDQAAVQEHLAGCVLCQNAAAEIHEWDSRLHAAMTSVPVPEGVRERLLAQLSKSSPTAAAQLIPQAPARRMLKWVFSGLSLSVALAAGLFYWSITPTQFQTAGVGAEAATFFRTHSVGERPAFDGSFSETLDDQRWQRVCPAPPVGLDLDGRAGHDVAAYQVHIPSLCFRGWLVMVPVSRISDVPASQVPVSIDYSQMASWRDDKYVYVCIAEEGSLKTLIAQFSGASA